MLALGIPVLVGLLVGVIAGGRLNNWQTAKFENALPACAALMLQLIMFDPPLERLDLIIAWGPLLYFVSLVIVLVVIGQNALAQPTSARSLGLAIAAFGVVLNCTVIAANGGYMPRAAVDGWARVPTPAEAGRLVNVAPMTSQTALAWLGDVLPEPAWMPLSNILSVGDVLLASGLGYWAFAITRAGLGTRRRAAAGMEALCPRGSAST